MAKDVVCGMQVVEATAKHTTQYRGKTYFFCSPGCKTKFDAHPAEYVEKHEGHRGVSPEQKDRHEHRGPAPKGKATVNAGTELYFCPMHPQITSKTPGRCPDCGMRLEPMSAPQPGESSDHHGHALSDFKKRFWISTALSIPIVLLSPMLQDWLGIGDSLRFSGDLYVLFALSTVVFVYGGYPFLEGLWGELRSSKPGMMTLIALAITVAYAYSSMVVFGLSGSIFFWELATLIDIMLIGHWIEMRSVQGASRALEELARLMPAIAHKLESNGSTTDVSLHELEVGDRVLVKPGEKIPADGIIQSGESSINEAMLTGESRPVPAAAKSRVIGGSINGEGSLTIEIQKVGSDSFLSQVINLVNEAQQSKSRTQDLANRAALWLTILAITAGAVTLTVWLGIMKANFSFALERAVTVMVITCPHALGLAVPLVVAISTSLSARKGLLIRNRRAFEVARNIDAIIFDKTGTLTKGSFGVTDVFLFDNTFDKDTLLKLAASVESHSEHPIAKAIAGYGGHPLPVDKFVSFPGKGAEGIVDGKRVQVVSPGFLLERNVHVTDDRIEKPRSEGKTIVYIVIDGNVLGAIALADIVREESRAVVRQLKEMGITCMMVTGDNNQTAEWVAREVGLDEFFAEVLPDQKAAKVKEVQARALTVAVVGDGVNDAPALAQADVGIAIGAGTDVAIETADIVLVRSDLHDVVHIVGLARATYRKMVQNLLWATGYNAVAIPLAAGVLYSFGILLSPAVGAVFMSASTVIVAINAKLLHI